ncbi:hypothetical protein lbkm_3470 [Lachnospiraceae bacterium KM106-2]|nr:hypothetical protein lbkm_3470 [Lachnospiraceae bacterium KM106-2]
MKPLHIYRKRFIPNETVLLKDDVILSETSEQVLTSWKTLKPRKDISHGVSAYILEKGYKISKIYNSSNDLVYWYCDIIESSWDHNSNELTTIDLLVDILIYPDESIHILDLDELQDAFNQGIISQYEFEHALIITQNLLKELRSGTFKQYQEMINIAELKK